jgi:NADPH2:quinone reductase
MQAIVLRAFGGTDQMRIETVDTPKPAPGEVRLRVHHSGVNPADWKMREGLLVNMFEHEFPIIPGWEAAGEIDALGEGVGGFSIGDSVYAMCRKPTIQHGSYAQHVIFPADWGARAPRNWQPAEIASVPLAGLTAWQALFQHGDLQPGARVLIQGAAGGVGSFAIQMARHAGARVAASAGSRNQDYIRSLGAEHSIDYTLGNEAQQLAAWAPEGVDFLLDTVRSVNNVATYDLVKPGGTIVYITGAPDVEAANRRSLRLAYFMVEPNGAQLTRITRLIEAGGISAPAVTAIPWEEAGKAHQLSREGHVRGKLVLRIG